jgi:hypothetical protein
MRGIGRTSKLGVWGAVAALTIGMVALGGPASAAPPGSSSAPTATASAEDPVGDTVTVAYDFNRAAKQAGQSVSCSLDGTPIACGSITESTKKLTSYSLDLVDLPDGEHVFAVTFALSDGGTASATAQFTINVIDSVEEACASVNGILERPLGYDFWCVPPAGGALAVGAFEVVDPWCAGTLVGWIDNKLICYFT